MEASALKLVFALEHLDLFVDLPEEIRRHELYAFALLICAAIAAALREVYRGG